jgi:hypothetical protein
MFKHLSYQHKLKWLGISILPILLICYQLAIKKTIREYQTYRAFAGQSAAMSTTSVLADLTDRKTSMLALYDRFSLDTFATDKNLLSIAGAFCKSHELMLKEYRTVGLGKLDSTRVLTRIMTFEGHFIPGVKFIYELEKQRTAGHVSSVQFSTIEDRQTKSTKLDLTLYIQNLIP